jgi:hypothetical protein
MAHPVPETLYGGAVGKVDLHGLVCIRGNIRHSGAFGSRTRRAIGGHAGSAAFRGCIEIESTMAICSWSGLDNLRINLLYPMLAVTNLMAQVENAELNGTDLLRSKTQIGVS